MTHSLCYFIFGDANGNAKYFTVMVRKSDDFEKPEGILRWSQKNSRRTMLSWSKNVINGQARPALVHRAFTFLEPLSFKVMTTALDPNATETAEKVEALEASLKAIGLEDINTANL